MDTGKTIKEIEQALIEDFAMFENWEDKYEYLID
jgi:cysteine desulfuration protein SufE